MPTIQLPDEVLILDQELARQWATSTRTLRTYDNLPDGLPYWIVAKRKYRGVKTSGEWLARHIEAPRPAEGCLMRNPSSPTIQIPSCLHGRREANVVPAKTKHAAAALHC